MTKVCAADMAFFHTDNIDADKVGIYILLRNFRKTKAHSIASLLLCILLMAATSLLLIGCDPFGTAAQLVTPPETNTEANTETISSPIEFPPFEIPVSVASGVNVEQNDSAIIDFSNASEGYIMAKHHQETQNGLRVVIETPTANSYVYFLTPGEFEVFPLTEGDGTYIIGIYEQVEGSRFRVVLKAHVEVALRDPLMPFLRPSQLVNFDRNSVVVQRANELVAGAGSFLDKVSVVFNFVIENIEYDFELARTVQVGYVPVLDEVLARGKGICYDYAAVMTAMLRSQGIPTQMVHGYTGELYHAWINVYSEEEGWINNIIFFDGTSWTLMDPTFAAVGGDGAAAEFIGDGTNYVSVFYF